MIWMSLVKVQESHSVSASAKQHLFQYVPNNILTVAACASNMRETLLKAVARHLEIDASIVGEVGGSGASL